MSRFLTAENNNLRYLGINALISIIAVIASGALWGITGMFLAIPLTAILKVIFDHIDEMKPWGYLLGNSIYVETDKNNDIIAK